MPGLKQIWLSFIEGAIIVGRVKVAFPLQHPLRWLELQSSYWRFRRQVRRALLRMLPRPLKERLKALPLRQAGARSIVAAKNSLSEAFSAPMGKIERNGFYGPLTLLPHLPPEEVTAIVDHELALTPLHRPDVICFSIIDWDFRYQRPQQIMSQFAARGHRVFYLNLSQFKHAHATPKVSARPLKENIYDISLAVHHPLEIYEKVIAGKDLNVVLDSLAELRRTFQIDEAIGYVMIASWGNVAIEARALWGWRLVYDCMDEWENFPNLKPAIPEMERALVNSSDLLVVTAQRLYEKWQPSQRPMVLARNAADYQFYAERCQPNDLLMGIKHPVIGYYGAITDWFDVELMEDIAAQRPEYTFVLLGGVFDADVSRLRAMKNVRLLGQQPDELMPQYLYHFDACLIPFKLNPITQATDPVKLYEYLSGGKPVVAVKLPELEAYRDDIYLAENKDDFLTKLDAALAEQDDALVARRKALAREHTWATRYEQIYAGLVEATPRASIIVVTYNNLALTRLCLESIIQNTQYPNYEIIVVDNHSADETPAYLRRLAAKCPQVKIILNAENDGFAKANNQGIAQASGDYLVLLNNDAIVPPGWLSRLLRYLHDPAIGLVGPVTNQVGNEAKVDATYRTWAEMESFARQYTWAHDAQISDIHMLAMYCVAIRREVFEEIGPLDEQFGIGMFEDDDYSLRVKQKGYQVICAADVFVHHFGQAAFGKLIQTGDYNLIFNENRQRYETKWNVPWVPHRNGQLALKPHRIPGAL